MNTKKIWMTAIIFGITAAGMMFLMVNEMPKESVKQASATESDKPEEKEEEVEVAADRKSVV